MARFQTSVPDSAELHRAATVLAAVHLAARGSVLRWVGVQQVVDATALPADEVEAAVDLLSRQRMLIANGTPALSVRLTGEGLQAARGELPARRPRAGNRR